MPQNLNKKIVVSLLAFVIIIAGWVVVINSEMSAEASSAVSANKVADGMLDVKMQVKENANGTMNMRFVSSVNGLGYYRVGFEVYFDADGSGTIEDKEGYFLLQTDKVLRRINAVNTGVTYNYSPKVIDTDAEYFITYTLTNISETLQERDFYVRAYVIPLDNKTTKEYGTGRYFNINDATNNAIINIPVEVAEDVLTEGSTANVTVAGVSSSATVEAYKDGYAHLNVSVPADAVVTTTKTANKTLLASANKIEVKTSDGSSVLGSTIYRNLDSTYTNNGADNSWYTVDTSADAFVIATDADLYGLTLAGIDANGAPKTVYLVSDITLNSGTVDSWEANGFKGLTQWKPASIWGTFDGQGHTISGLYLSTASQNAGMFGNVKCNAIKNFSLKNSYLESTFTPDANIGSIAGTFGGNMVNVYSDAKVVTTKGFKAGGLVGYGAHQKSDMSGCCFAGDLVVNNQSAYQPYTGGFIGQAAQPLTLTNCLFTGNVDATWTKATSASPVAFYVGGLAGYCSSTVSIANCLSNGTVYALWNTQTQATPTTMTGVASLIGGAQSTVTISNVYDFNDVKRQTDGGVAANASATSVTDAYYDKSNNKMVSLDTTVLRLNDSLLLGADGCRYTTLDFENTWAAVEGELPVLKTFAENPIDLTGVTNLVDYGWYGEYTGETTDPYILDNSQDLYGFSILSNSSAYSKVNSKEVQLKAETEFKLNVGTVAEWKGNEFSGLNNWIPIQNFAGKFDGQGSVICGLYHVTDATTTGLFKNTTTSAVLGNFSLKNSYLVSNAELHAMIGSIVGNAGGSMTNVYSEAEVVTDGGFKAGGLIGQTTGNYQMTGCWFDGNVVVKDQVSYQPYAGGFVGQAASTLNLTDCLFTGTVNATWELTANNNSKQQFYVGGFAGMCSSTAAITNCLSDGTVYALWNTKAQATPTMLGVASMIGSAQSTVTTSNVYDFNTVTQQIDSGTATPITYAAYDKNTSTGIDKCTTVLRLTDSLLLGTDGCRYTTLDFESEYGWAAVDGKLPQLKYFTETPMDLTGVTNLVDYGWYSESDGAEATPYVLSDSKDLYGFSMISTIDTFANEYVKLTADTTFTLNEGTVDQWKEESFAGLNNWHAVNNFAGTFDGQESVISGLYLTQSTNCAGLFGKLTTAATIQNLSLKESYVHSSATPDARVGSIVGWAQGGALTLQNVYSNAEVVASNGMSAGGFVGYCHTNAPLKATGCWFAGDVVVNDQSSYQPYAGGFVGQTANTMELTDCLFTGNVDATWEVAANNSSKLQLYVGGFAGMCSSTSTITNCLLDGTVYAYWNTKAEATPTMLGVASLIGSAKGGVTVSDVYDFNMVTQQTDGGVAAGTNAIPITYATYNNTTGGGLTLNTRVLRLSESLLLGADGCRYTALDFQNTWVAVDGKLPQLKYFAENPMDLDGVTNLVDYGWYSEANGAQATPYVLNDSKDLYGFSIISTIDTFANEYVKLAADTTFTLNEGTVDKWKEDSFAGLDNWHAVNNFAGTFDGQGSVINGLYLTQSTNCAGLFGKLTTAATIQNLSLKESYVHSSATPDARVGSIVGWAQGGTLTLQNVYSNAEVVASNGMSAGGFVGYCHTNAPLKATGCWFAGDVVVNDKSNYQPYAGGFVGQTANTMELTDCQFTGKVDVTWEYSANDSSSKQLYVGGFAGMCSSTSTMTNCLLDGTVYAYWNTKAQATPTILGVASLIGSAKGGVTASDVYDFNTVTQQTDGGMAAGSAATEIAYATYNNTAGTGIRLNTRVLRLSDSLFLGADGCRYTALDFDSTWAAVDGKLPQLRYFTENPMDLTGVTNLADYAWYYETDGTQATPYLLSDSKDLYGFSIIAIINNFSDKYIQLASGTTYTMNSGTPSDWETNGYTDLIQWRPIANFAGNFDGQGSVINGIYCTADAEQLGLFKNTTTAATISNLTLQNSYLFSTAYPVANIGSIIGNAGGSMTNVHSSAIVETDGGFKAGGLIGTAAAAYTMTNCSFHGDVLVNFREPHSTSWGVYAGGLIAQAAKAVTLTDCAFYGDIDVTYMRADAEVSDYNFYIGGLIGRCHEGGTISNYTSQGHISVSWLKNLWVDYTAGSQKTPSVFNCCNGVYTVKETATTVPTTSGTNVDSTIITTDTTGTGGIFMEYPEIGNNLPGSGTITTKYNMGEQDYGMKATSVTQTQYNNYITALINAGFVKHSDNGTMGMDDGRIYTTNLVKDDITVTVSYITKVEELHLTASYEVELSEHLNYNADSVPVNSTEQTKLHMPELNCVGSSFIIELKNGHFVIEDGGNPNDAPYLLDYLESLVPEGEKPVIEGWFISHPHVDHFGALQAIVENEEYRNRIYVEGVYFTLMTQALMEYMLPGSTSGEYSYARDICTYNQSLVRENGEQTKFHRTIMGQKYYFCDVEIDVVYTLEQSRHDGTDRNDNSTWLMYHIAGQRVLNTADANTDSFDDILYYYDTDYLDIDVYTTPHHGINVTEDFNSKLGLDSSDTVLYSNWRKGSLWWTTDHMSDAEKEEMDYLYTSVYTSGPAVRFIGSIPYTLEAYDANIALQAKVGANNVYSRGVVVNFTSAGRTVDVLEDIVWKYSQYCVDGVYYPERSLYTNE